MEDLVNDVRESSRQLVRRLGFMRPTLADTDLSASAVHTLIEIGRAGSLNAAALSTILGLEKSSVSRMIANLVGRAEIAVKAATGDGRVKQLTLTRKGRATLAVIDRFAVERVGTALGRLPPNTRATVRNGLAAYAGALAEAAQEAPSVVRGYRPGIVGRAATMHADYYSRAFGFGAVFERRVASEFAEFVGRLDRGENGAWSAVYRGEIVGTIAIDGEDMGANLAHLRWFIVDDAVRGTGAGRKLLDAALAHCDALGRETRLWTFRGLDSARHLYEQCEFVLIHEAPGTQWGREVVEQMFARPPGTATS